MRKKKEVTTGPGGRWAFNVNERPRVSRDAREDGPALEAEFISEGFQ
jgi:hypothetical protein